MPALDPVFRSRWPQLTDTNHEITSLQGDTYNCVAWALGYTDRSLWPANPQYQAWPTGIDQTDSINALIELFQAEGFELIAINDVGMDDGYEKVALYADGDEPLHVSRQLPSGRWTSKLGFEREDIAHDAPQLLEGQRYGAIVVVMRRQVGSAP